MCLLISSLPSMVLRTLVESQAAFDFFVLFVKIDPRHMNIQ